ALQQHLAQGILQRLDRDVVARCPVRQLPHLAHRQLGQRLGHRVRRVGGQVGRHVQLDGAREVQRRVLLRLGRLGRLGLDRCPPYVDHHLHRGFHLVGARVVRSEEHTSELQSRENLVCRLLLEKKKKKKKKKKTKKQKKKTKKRQHKNKKK